MNLRLLCLSTKIKKWRFLDKKFLNIGIYRFRNMVLWKIEFLYSTLLRGIIDKFDIFLYNV